MPEAFQSRIHYQGPLEPLLKQVAKEFNLGTYHSHQVIPFGYEDFNLSLKTNQGKYFVKIFGSFRSREDCQRLITVVEQALIAGVSHPKLIKSTFGYLYEIELGSKVIRLSVQEFIEGKTFFQLCERPTLDEARELGRQAALINQLDLRPVPIYDSWAIPNIAKEFSDKEKFLEPRDRELVHDVLVQFSKLDCQKLPHCFVHGDITTTNVIKDAKNKLYILDFSVSNFYVRIQELAVLLSSLMFFPGDLNKTQEYYKTTLTEYQKISD